MSPSRAFSALFLIRYNSDCLFLSMLEGLFYSLWMCVDVYHCGVIPLIVSLFCSLELYLSFEALCFVRIGDGIIYLVMYSPFRLKRFKTVNEWAFLFIQICHYHQIWWLIVSIMPIYFVCSCKHSVTALFHAFVFLVSFTTYLWLPVIVSIEFCVVWSFQPARWKVFSERLYFPHSALFIYFLVIISVIYLTMNYRFYCIVSPSACNASLVHCI